MTHSRVPPTGGNDVYVKGGYIGAVNNLDKMTLSGMSIFQEVVAYDGTKQVGIARFNDKGELSFVTGESGTWALDKKSGKLIELSSKPKLTPTGFDLAAGMIKYSLTPALADAKLFDGALVDAVESGNYVRKFSDAELGDADVRLRKNARVSYTIHFDSEGGSLMADPLTMDSIEIITYGDKSSWSELTKKLLMVKYDTAFKDATVILGVNLEGNLTISMPNLTAEQAAKLDPDIVSNVHHGVIHSNDPALGSAQLRVKDPDRVRYTATFGVNGLSVTPSLSINDLEIIGRSPDDKLSRYEETLFAFQQSPNSGSISVSLSMDADNKLSIDLQGLTQNQTKLLDPSFIAELKAKQGIEINDQSSGTAFLGIRDMSKVQYSVRLASDGVKGSAVTALNNLSCSGMSNAFGEYSPMSLLLNSLINSKNAGQLMLSIGLDDSGKLSGQH